MENKASTPEETYIKNTPLSYRRKNGQYFTPLPVAEIMSEWVSTCMPNSLLDPAIGLGIFPRAYERLAENPFVEWRGFDIDPHLVEQTRTTLKHLSGNVTVSEEDFLQSSWETSYDGIMANPPYFKLRLHENKQELLQTFEEKLGFRLPGNTNIYNLFILKALEQLQEGGRAAFLVPFEFLNADYGYAIKKYLVDHHLLRYVVVTDLDFKWFDDAITTSCLLLCSREQENDLVEFLSVTSFQDLEEITAHIKGEKKSDLNPKRYAVDQLDPKTKWRSYYQENVLDSFKNVKPFYHFGKASRGIATGANDFFCITESEQRKWNLPQLFLVPCLTKAAHAKAPFFQTEDWVKLKGEDRAVQLLQIDPFQLDENLRKYIQYGERNSFHERYLTKNRKPWYKPEKRKPAPILFRVFNRNRLQFIRNEASILHLTPFHSVYLHEEYEGEVDIIMAYFLTNIAELIIKESRREYGDGLLKFEPNDINQGYVYDFDLLSDAERIQIRKLYNQYRSLFLDGKPTDLVKDKLTKIFEQLLKE